MVSHVYCTNLAMLKDPLNEFNLWEHLKAVKSSSFNRAIKRKRQRDNDIALCDSLGSLQISRSKHVPVESMFKKLCISDAPMPCLATPPPMPPKSSEEHATHADAMRRHAKLPLKALCEGQYKCSNSTVCVKPAMNNSIDDSLSLGLSIGNVDDKSVCSQPCLTADSTDA